MIHVRLDRETNDKRQFACGIGPALPDGDKWVHADEYELLHMVDCQGCGGRVRQSGTPVSELDGRPGHPGYEQFKDIARSWGHS
jgi:hypothetical protein